MRADRLMSILLILQNRGRTTAQVLAQELDVSMRTIYRDIDALCVAGVPLYTDRGPGGGISLLDSYRTDLTGLTDEEKRSLFLLTVPTPLNELGLNQQLTGALVKIQASLPVTHRNNEKWLKQCLLLDWAGWKHTKKNIPHLRALQEAVWNNQMINIAYRSILRDHIANRDIAPYSLVAKAGIWYLVGVIGNQKRVYLVSRIVSVKKLFETFIRPPSFNLASFWRDYCHQYEQRHTYYKVLARVNPQAIPYLRYILGDQVQENLNRAQYLGEDDWLTVELTFESLEVARGQILSFGCAVEVLEPLALKMSIMDYAEQIGSLYNRK